MGVCISYSFGDEDDKDKRKKSHSIDKLLEESNKKNRRECKILLLGAGESGKSTIVKQMKMIYQNGYSNEELKTWRVIVYKNLLESAQSLVMAMAKLGFSFKQAENEERAKIILNFKLSSDANFVLTTAVMESIELVWQDPGSRECLEKGVSEFYIMDSASYFFDEVGRIKQPNYVPNEQDVLRARQKSTGIAETRFNAGHMDIHMFDVGGQRSERRKWIHCFEGVTSIIFCIALNEYDQVLLEEAEQNRMVESLVLFESVVNSRWFLRTSIILFLNKIDLFRLKISKVPLERYFPDYIGGPDVNKAARYILWRFMKTNRARLTTYSHMTNATDTSNIRVVFSAVQDTILQNALKDSGIL